MCERTIRLTVMKIQIKYQLDGHLSQHANSNIQCYSLTITVTLYDRTNMTVVLTNDMWKWSAPSAEAEGG